MFVIERLCVCMCVCVWTERERVCGSERGRDRKRGMCVCVCKRTMDIQAGSRFPSMLPFGTHSYLTCALCTHVCVAVVSNTPVQ